MDIKKLTTQLKETQQTRHNQESSAASGAKSVSGNKEAASDRVSLESYQFRKNEVLFARSEYDKQSQNSFDKLKAYKTKVNEYEEAKSTPGSDAGNTEIGKKLNNPEVWEAIARKMLDV